MAEAGHRVHAGKRPRVAAEDDVASGVVLPGAAGDAGMVPGHHSYDADQPLSVPLHHQHLMHNQQHAAQLLQRSAATQSGQTGLLTVTLCDAAGHELEKDVVSASLLARAEISVDPTVSAAQVKLADGRLFQGPITFTVGTSLLLEIDADRHGDVVPTGVACRQARCRLVSLTEPPAMS